MSASDAMEVGQVGGEGSGPARDQTGPPPHVVDPNILNFKKVGQSIFTGIHEHAEPTNQLIGMIRKDASREENITIKEVAKSARSTKNQTVFNSQ